MTITPKVKKDIIADPSSHFDTPENLIESEDLTLRDKRLALKTWAEDAERLSAAANEGMTGGERSLLPDVKAAEAVLDPKAKAPVPHVTVPGADPKKP